MAARGINTKYMYFKSQGVYNYYKQLKPFVLGYMEHFQNDFTDYDRKTLDGNISEFIIGVRKTGTDLVPLNFVNMHKSKELLKSNQLGRDDKFFYGKDGKIIEIEKDELKDFLNNRIKKIARDNNKPIDEIIVNADNFYKNELEQIRSLFDKHGRLNWNENLAKEIYENEMPKIPLSMFISGMCCGQGNVIISPYPDYTFRFTDEGEFDDIMDGKRSGGYWRSEPTEYAGRDIMLVSKNRSRNKYQIEEDAPNGHRDSDKILAVYLSTGDSKKMNPYKPIFVKDGFDIKNLEFDYNERVEEIVR